MSMPTEAGFSGGDGVETGIVELASGDYSIPGDLSIGGLIKIGTSSGKN